MRSIAAQSAAVALIVASLGPFAKGADEPRAPTYKCMAEIIAGLRAEEEKYRDIEYLYRVTTRDADPKVPDQAGEIVSEVTRKVVLQGERIFFRGSSTDRTLKPERHREEVSACDGETTRTVVAGNCANVHEGRYEHPDILPPHALSLPHYRLKFPLSVYLSGTEAIHAYPNYPSPAGSPRDTAMGDEFQKVTVRFEGEELIDGLRCLKIRCYRWFEGWPHAFKQYLWLAPDRNYFCVKEQLLFLLQGQPGTPLLQEMHVASWREVAPGRWFPAKVTVDGRDLTARMQPRQGLVRCQVLLVAKVVLAPQHDLAFFRDLAIPADLPILTNRDGLLESSSRPEPVGDEHAQQATLKEIIARVQENELRYADIEVSARSRYRHFGSDLTGFDMAEENHSVLRGGLALYNAQSLTTLRGERSEKFQVSAYDGQWTRKLTVWGRDGDEQVRGSLGKGAGGKVGRHDAVERFRPHSLLSRFQGFPGPLCDILGSPWLDANNKRRLRVQPCGEGVVEAHPCLKVSGETVEHGGQPARKVFVLWLAIDRNYIPIKYENYESNPPSPIPDSVGLCTDFREIAPGTWYPFRVASMAFNASERKRRRLLLDWRHEFETLAVTLAPKANNAMFHDVVVPKGAEIGVVNEDGDDIGSFRQPEDGVPTLPPARYLAMLSEAKIGDEERKARERAMQALVGQRAPDFPKGALWLKGGPRSWKDLAGQVVILDFWAEWSAPCQNLFPELNRLHANRDSNKLTIIGVHPPGSERQAIEKVMDEFHLEYPICVDVPQPEGLSAWGSLHSKFAVRSIPHAVAVDSNGTIVAFGSLADVVAKARSVVERAGSP